MYSNSVTNFQQYCIVSEISQLKFWHVFLSTRYTFTFRYFFSESKACHLSAHSPNAQQQWEELPGYSTFHLESMIRRAKPLKQFSTNNMQKINRLIAQFVKCGTWFISVFSFRKQSQVFPSLDLPKIGSGAAHCYTQEFDIFWSKKYVEAQCIY
jgi:hypothetical protein